MLWAHDIVNLKFNNRANESPVINYNNLEERSALTSLKTEGKIFLLLYLYSSHKWESGF